MKRPPDKSGDSDNADKWRIIHRKRRQKAAMRIRDRASPARKSAGSGEAVFYKERSPSGKTSALIGMQCSLPGAVSRDPAVAFSHRMRLLMRPISVSDCLVTDKNGVPIAVIRVDPVTGKRTRENLT